MRQATEVAVIGAGPYGLSIAAHLSKLGVPFRIFGKPMESWLTQMPRGMLLKSEGFASSIYHPEGNLTLGQYCQEMRLPYSDIGLPVPLETFCEYGLAFQRQFVSTLEQKLVTAIDRSRSGFRVMLDDGKTVAARRVVVAAGISHFSHVPSSIEGLPRRFVSHSSEHAELTAFGGSDVVVLGGGASAVDVAALLHESGANARTRRTQARTRTAHQERPVAIAVEEPARAEHRHRSVMEILVLHELRHDLPSLAREKKAEVGANPPWTSRRMVHGRSHRLRSPNAWIHADRRTRTSGCQSRTA